MLRFDQFSRLERALRGARRHNISVQLYRRLVLHIIATSKVGFPADPQYQAYDR